MRLLGAKGKKNVVFLLRDSESTILFVFGFLPSRRCKTGSGDLILQQQDPAHTLKPDTRFDHGVSNRNVCETVRIALLRSYACVQ